MPHGEAKNATDTWSKHHDSSPLQKEIQSIWDDLNCRDSVTNPCTRKSHYCCMVRSHFQSQTLETCSTLVSSIHIAIALQTSAKNFVRTKCHCSKIVDKLGLHAMGAHALKTQAAFRDIQPSTPFSGDHKLAFISLPPLSPLAWQGIGAGLALGPW